VGSRSGSVRMLAERSDLDPSASQSGYLFIHSFVVEDRGAPSSRPHHLYWSAPKTRPRSSGDVAAARLPDVGTSLIILPILIFARWQSVSSSTPMETSYYAPAHPAPTSPFASQFSLVEAASSDPPSAVGSRHRSLETSAHTHPDLRQAVAAVGSPT
jgi:hypothetical protein